MKKTNAVRILDRLKIDYSITEYPVDENDLSAEHLAESAGIPIERVYKTLVVRGDKNGIYVCILPGEMELDLKKASTASQNKKSIMIQMKELLPLTGYIRGGCTALGMKKNFPVYLDKSALNFDRIYVSAGKRGQQIYLSPPDLKKAANAKIFDLSAAKNK